jgi:hypothetical protein
MENKISKEELITSIEAAWATMQHTLAGLSEPDLTTPDPVTGWSVKEHLAHLAAWEQGIAALLQSRSRWVAMGVDEATVEATDMDGLNDILVAQSRQRSLATVLTEFQQAHQEMIAVLTKFSETDLYRSYAHYQPGGSSDPVINWVIGNTYEHYAEHQAWLETMLKEGKV